MANYAESSHRLHGTFDEVQLASLRSLDRTYLSQDEYRAIQMHLYDLVKLLSNKLNLRQQAIATSMVYILRFYTRAAFVETNVYMVVAAAVYLACKIEECPQHIKIVTAEIQTVWGLGKVSGETQKLAEAEFYLINELDTHLIVHHPYRVLNTFTNLWKGWQRDIDEAWIIINESYSTDIPLLFQPDIIAYTSLFLTLVRRRYTSNAEVSSEQCWQGISARCIDSTELARCIKAFLSFWNFRDSGKSLDGESILKRAKEELSKVESGVVEKEAKSRRYKEKIQAMQKR